MLIRDVVSGYGGTVTFESVDWGQSDKPAKYGVTRYPVVFVDDVLIAQPLDFGWDNAGGRYSPFSDPANHEKFKTDLRRAIDRRLRGEAFDSGVKVTAADALPVQALPDFSLIALDGQPLTRAALAGRPVVVEFWATWCPPCRGTLQWLGDLRRRHGEALGVAAFAIQSEEADARRVIARYGLEGQAALGSDTLARAFGDVSAVPTLLVFGRDGRTAAVFYGAPPDLHQRVDAVLNTLLARPER